MDGGDQRERTKKKSVRIVMVFLIILIPVILWIIEKSRPIHVTAGNHAEISTPYYDLWVPMYWRWCVTAETEPTGEIYKGYRSDGQSSIKDENYTLVISYKTKEGKYPVARVSMYQYVQDRMAEEDQENWCYLGMFTYGGDYGKFGAVTDVYLILDYASVPEELSTQQQQKWQKIRDELTPEMFSSNIMTLEEPVDGICSWFEESESKNPQGNFSDWETERKRYERKQKEMLEHSEKWEMEEAVRKAAEEKEALKAALKEQEKEEKRKAAQKAAQKAKEEREAQQKKASSSSSSVCKYPGCRNYGIYYRKGYCNKHYKQLYGSRDDYYDEDPDSYYSDNKDTYRSYDEAEDEWYDEYED